MSAGHEIANAAGAAAEHGGGHSLAHQLHEHWAFLVQLILPKQFGHVEYIVVSMLLVALYYVFFSRASRSLALYPRGRVQSFLELLYESLSDFVIGIVGPDGQKYVPLVGTVFIFVFGMNMIGIVPGLIAPTSNLNVTFAMAISVFILVQAIAITELGFKNYLLHLCGEPLWMAPLMLPIHVIGELAKPMSLAFRLFGNIFGEDQVVINLAALAIVIYQATNLPIPVHFPMLAFGIFTSFVQGLVFALLTAIYIVLFIGGHHEGHGEHGHDDSHGDPHGSHH